MSNPKKNRAKKSGKSKNGNKKHGRNKIFCEQYRRIRRRERNKCKRVTRHLFAHPGDRVAYHCLNNMSV